LSWAAQRKPGITSEELEVINLSYPPGSWECRLCGRAYSPTKQWRFGWIRSPTTNLVKPCRGAQYCDSAGLFGPPLGSAPAQHLVRGSGKWCAAAKAPLAYLDLFASPVRDPVVDAAQRDACERGQGGCRQCARNRAQRKSEAVADDPYTRVCLPSNKFEDPDTRQLSLGCWTQDLVTVCYNCATPRPEAAIEIVRPDYYKRKWRCASDLCRNRVWTSNIGSNKYCQSCGRERGRAGGPWFYTVRPMDAEIYFRRVDNPELRAECLASIGMSDW
jgi:hypothetical protein